MARWTLPDRLAKQAQLSDSVLDCDRIIVPVHQGNHWVSGQAAAGGRLQGGIRKGAPAVAMSAGP